MGIKYAEITNCICFLYDHIGVRDGLLFITQGPVELPPLPPQPGQTGFITSDLILPTLEASTGDAVISVTLTNTGTAEVTHELKLVIDGK